MFSSFLFHCDQHTRIYRHTINETILMNLGRECTPFSACSAVVGGGSDFIESQNYIMVWVGRDLLKIIQDNSPVGRDIFLQIRLLEVPSDLTLNTSNDGASTPSLGNLFQCLTSLIIKKILHMSNLNLPCSSVIQLLLVLPLQALVKNLSLSFL